MHNLDEDTKVVIFGGTMGPHKLLIMSSMYEGMTCISVVPATSIRLPRRCSILGI